MTSSELDFEEKIHELRHVIRGKGHAAIGAFKLTWGSIRDIEMPQVTKDKIQAFCETGIAAIKKQLELESELTDTILSRECCDDNGTPSGG